MQVVLLLDFVHGWNDKWVAYDEQFWCVYLSFLYPCNSSSLFAYLMLIFFFFFFYIDFYLLCPLFLFWCRYTALFVVSLVCYVLTFSFSGLLFYLFTPSGHDCGLNTFFIVVTLICVFAFAIVALHPAVSSWYCFHATRERKGKRKKKKEISIFIANFTNLFFYSFLMDE